MQMTLLEGVKQEYLVLTEKQYSCKEKHHCVKYVKFLSDKWNKNKESPFFYSI